MISWERIFTVGGKESQLYRNKINVPNKNFITSHPMRISSTSRQRAEQFQSQSFWVDVTSLLHVCSAVPFSVKNNSNPALLLLQGFKVAAAVQHEMFQITLMYYDCESSYVVTYRSNL